jgi:hypothetical protein
VDRGIGDWLQRKYVAGETALETALAGDTVFTCAAPR